jgi:hypothetical protein
VAVKEEKEEEEKKEKLSPHYLLMQELWNVSKKHKLAKRDGMIYKPRDEKKRCAYEPYMKYADFINHVLQGNMIYTSAPKRFADLMKHLENYNDKELPFIKINRRYIAFQNRS